ncbi:MAG TPA: enoyl-CoA hydratase-related protein, partial [Gammaproteobacteria bacterium]
MNEQQVLVETDRRGVATVTLNRPDKHNAFNAEMIAELTAALQALDRDAAVRVVVLTGAGKSFSAGADLNWMKSMAAYSEAENLDD